MLFAIVKLNLQINHRIASDDPLGHLVLDTFVNALTEWLADDPAKDFIDELVTCSALIWLNTYSAFGKLPRSPRLLFMTITYVSLATNGLTIRNLGKLCRDLNPTTL